LPQHEFEHQVSLNVRQWLDLETGSRVILTVGNHHRQKGQDALLAAMPHILAKMPKVILFIVGANQGPLAEQAQSKGFEKHIRLTGPNSFPCHST
jgi:glycosyltransferase involved in cell wall biosynthesis